MGNWSKRGLFGGFCWLIDFWDVAIFSGEIRASLGNLLVHRYEVFFFFWSNHRYEVLQRSLLGRTYIVSNWIKPFVLQYLMTNTICGEFTWVPMTMDFFFLSKNTVYFLSYLPASTATVFNIPRRKFGWFFFATPPTRVWNPGLRPNSQPKKKWFSLFMSLVYNINQLVVFCLQWCTDSFCKSTWHLSKNRYRIGSSSWKAHKSSMILLDTCVPKSSIFFLNMR